MALTTSELQNRFIENQKKNGMKLLTGIWVKAKTKEDLKEIKKQVKDFLNKDK